MWQSGEMCGNHNKMEKCDKMRPMETHWLHLHISKIHLSAMCLLAFIVGWFTQFQKFDFFSETIGGYPWLVVVLVVVVVVVVVDWVALACKLQSS